MVQFKNEKGDINISSEVISSVTGAAATKCFGVRGMAFRNKTDGIVMLLRRESMSKGVKVTYNPNGSIDIDLHIIVSNDVNFTGVSENIMSEVRYMVTSTTGVPVNKVNIFIDGVEIG